MKATELRIGNYYNSHGAFKKATPNTIEELFESENRTWIQPIQLTEEILLKCGFKKDGNFYHFKAFAIYVKRTN